MNNVPCRDPIRNLVNSTQRSDVRLVMVDGEILVENGKLVKEDEQKLTEDVQRASESIYRRLPSNHPFKRSADEVSPPAPKELGRRIHLSIRKEIRALCRAGCDW